MRDVLAQALANQAPMPARPPLPLPPPPPTNDQPMEDPLPSTSNTPTTPTYSFNPKLFLGGLHHNVTEDMLKAYFEKYGKIVDIYIPKNRETGAKRGFGFLKFNVSFKLIR